jgi:probable blue pigment (indigoidine) exporter
MQPTRPVAREERTGILLAAGAAVLYGAAYPATGVALRSFTPLAIAAIACSIALPVVLLLAYARVIARPSRAAFNGPSLLRLLILTGFGGIGFIAVTNVAVALAGSTVTGFVAPLYAVSAALLAVPVLGERIRGVTLASFGMAIIGTALLAGISPSANMLTGIALAAGSAVMFGMYIVLARRWGRPYHLDGTLVTVANLASRGPLLLLIEWLRAPGTLVPTDPDPAAVIALLTIAFGSSSTANLLLMASVKRVAASRTSAALLLTPVSSALISVVILGQRLDPIQVVGGALILGGIAGASGLLDRRGRRGDRPVGPDVATPLPVPDDPDPPPVGQG